MNNQELFETLEDVGVIYPVDAEDGGLSYQIDCEKLNEVLGELLENKSNEKKIPFQEFWDLYDKKRGRPKCEKMWNKLSLKKQKLAMEHIPKYKEAQPDKVYRKDPERYLRYEVWNDEIIKPKNIRDNNERETLDFDFEKASF